MPASTSILSWMRSLWCRGEDSLEVPRGHPVFQLWPLGGSWELLAQGSGGHVVEGNGPFPLEI